MIRFSRGIFFLAAGTAVLCISSCNRTPKVEAHIAETPVVAVAKASVEDLSKNLVLTAEFRPFQEVDVMSKVAGFVKSIQVDVGDHVRQGQLLATLEIPEMTDEITRAQAGLDRSRAEVRRAQDDVQRAESAHQIAHLSYTRLAGVMKERPGLIAQQEVDDAHGRDLVAEAQTASARSGLDSASQRVKETQAELEKYKTLFNYTRVTAPFAGVITKRFADTGSMIQAGTASQTQAMPLVRLSENSLLRLILPVPESVVSHVRVGGQVEVLVPSLGRTFSGKVARFADRVQTATRTMDTEVDVPNPGLVLVPGMYAQVNLTLNQRHSALAIPVGAIELADETSGEGQPAAKSHGKAMVVAPDGRLSWRKVDIGLETASRVEILSGIQEGEQVVVGNRSGLQPGQLVRPKLTEMVESKSGS